MNMKDQTFNQMLNLVRRFSVNKIGAVTIEFFFMILLLGILFAFMADLVVLRSTLGKLDTASFSLVNILRERTQLYGGRANITDGDLAEFRQLAKLILFDDKNSVQKVDVVLEYWAQDSSGNETVETKGDIGDCQPYHPIRDLKDLSPYSEVYQRSRKVPLYQVTLCVEGKASLFKALVLNDKTKTDLGLIRSSTLAVSR